MDTYKTTPLLAEIKGLIQSMRNFYISGVENPGKCTYHQKLDGKQSGLVLMKYKNSVGQV